MRRLRRLDKSGKSVEAVKLGNLRHPMELRQGTDDASAVINNIVREEYGQLNPGLNPVSLIDAGAYIGDTSAYFLSKFPGLHSIALEPNPDSFAMAARNLKPYGNRVELLPLALSAEPGDAFISGREMGAQVNAQSGIKVRTTTVPELLERLPGGRVSILKMDIEGSEAGIFSASPEAWLPQVDCMLIETHDTDITRLVMAVLAENNWHAKRFRSLFYCQPCR